MMNRFRGRAVANDDRVTTSSSGRRRAAGGLIGFALAWPLWGSGASNQVLLTIEPVPSDEQIARECRTHAMPDGVSGASRRLIQTNAQMLGISPDELFRRNCVTMRTRDRDQRLRAFSDKVVCELRRIADWLDAPGATGDALRGRLEPLGDAPASDRLNLSALVHEHEPFTGDMPCSTGASPTDAAADDTAR